MFRAVVWLFGIYVHEDVVVADRIEERRFYLRDEVGELVLLRPGTRLVAMPLDEVTDRHHEGGVHQVAATERVRERAAIVAPRAIRHDSKAEVLRIVLKIQM